MAEKKEVKTSKKKIPRTWVSRRPDNPTEGKRVKASPTFLPSHWAAIEADGRKLTVCLDEALSVSLFPTPENLRRLVDKLTPIQRLDLFENYCTFCGNDNPVCTCMRDD